MVINNNIDLQYLYHLKGTKVTTKCILNPPFNLIPVSPLLFTTTSSLRGLGFWPEGAL